MPAGYAATFAVVRDLTSYPQWWPEVKKVEQIEQDRALVTIRALLPYSLRFEMRREVDDIELGVLEATMTGDLEGTSSWQISEQDGGCSMVFEEQVTTNKLLLRVLAPIARPAFTLNHAVMMRRGQAGLRKYLSR